MLNVTAAEEVSSVKKLFFSPYRLNDYSDSPQNSRGVYASSNGAARVGGRQSNGRTLSDSDGQDKRSRIGLSRPSMQTTSSQLTKGSSTSGPQDGPPACQLTNRKARGTKTLDLQSQSLVGSTLPHRALSPEDGEYANLIGAMDNDLDRPEPLSVETLQEQSSQSVQNKGTHTVFSEHIGRAEGLCNHQQIFEVYVNIFCSLGIQREAAGQSQSPEEEGREREKIDIKDSGRRAQR